MPWIAVILLYLLHAFDHGFDLDDHTGATAVGIVVHRMMFVMRIVAYIVNHDVHQSPLASSLDDALLEWGGKHFREETQNIDAHGLPQQKPLKCIS